MTRVKYTTVNVPADQYAVIKRWVASGKSPYTTPAEAYRSELRRMTWELETEKAESSPTRAGSLP